MSYTILPVPQRSSGLSTDRPQDPPPGWEFFETDTKRKIMWTGDEWMKIAGKSQKLSESTEQGQILAPKSLWTTVYTGPAFAMPVGGNVLGSSVFQWLAQNNAAAWANLEIIIGGAAYTTISSARVHNIGTGYGIWKNASVPSGRAYLPAGSGYQARLVLGVDGGGADVYTQMNTALIVLE